MDVRRKGGRRKEQGSINLDTKMERKKKKEKKKKKKRIKRQQTEHPTPLLPTWLFQKRTTRDHHAHFRTLSIYHFTLLPMLAVAAPGSFSCFQTLSIYHFTIFSANSSLDLPWSITVHQIQAFSPTLSLTLYFPHSSFRPNPLPLGFRFSLHLSHGFLVI